MEEEMYNVYQRLMQRAQPRTFSYIPDENDAELGLRRRRALFDSGVDRMQTTDELNRSGLLGSGAAFGVLGEQAARTGRTLEDINADVFAKRRMEALDQFNREEDFRRQLALLKSQQDFQNSQGMLGGLGKIGALLGEVGLSGLTGGASKLLPLDAISGVVNDPNALSLPATRMSYLK